MDHKNCPVCNTELKVTTFGTKVWKDCTNCNKTLEELIVIAKTTDNSSSLTNGYTFNEEVWDEFVKAIL